MSVHVTSSCHVRRCRVMSCHVMSRRSVMSCDGASSWSCMSCQVTSRHVISCHVASCHVMSCHVVSCHVRRAASCRVVLCRVMPNCVLTRRVLPWMMSLRFTHSHTPFFISTSSHDVCQHYTCLLHLTTLFTSYNFNFTCGVSGPVSTSFQYIELRYTRFIAC